MIPEVSIPRVNARFLTHIVKIAERPMRTGETNDPGAAQAHIMLRLPSVLRKLYTWYTRYIQRDPLYADLVDICAEKTAVEYYDLIAQREGYRSKWFDMWNEEGLDFVLTVPNAIPAVPHGGMKHGFKSCGYTLLFNVVSRVVSIVLCILADVSNNHSSTTPQASYQSRMLTDRWTNCLQDSKPKTPSKHQPTLYMIRMLCTGSQSASK